MEKVYLISTCVRIKKRYSIFHFKGYYKGVRITEVYIENLNSSEKFSIGGEYLIKIYAKGVEQNVLFGEAMRSKRLNELTSY
jgi:hypothetical protein